MGGQRESLRRAAQLGLKLAAPSMAILSLWGCVAQREAPPLRFIPEPILLSDPSIERPADASADRIPPRVVSAHCQVLLAGIAGPIEPLMHFDRYFSRDSALSLGPGLLDNPRRLLGTANSADYNNPRFGAVWKNGIFVIRPAKKEKSHDASEFDGGTWGIHYLVRVSDGHLFTFTTACRPIASRK